MAYACAPPLNSCPWNSGFVAVGVGSSRSRLCPFETLKFSKVESSKLCSFSAGNLARATTDGSFHKVSDEEENEVEENAFQVVTAISSNYNDIVIVDTPKSRMLLLDSSHNIHSILYKEQKWTGSYWDEFASLPAIIPEGPIAIFGLGGGTTAHLMLASWPSLQLEGWEIDGFLIDQARDFFGLSDLEKPSDDGGILNIHIGDVLDPSVKISGGYAGIVVDLFSNGKVLSQLQEASTWLDLKDRLMAGGRLMINCGGNEATNITENGICSKVSSSDSLWLHNLVIEAVSKAFPGQLSWKKLSKEKGENYLALTGPFPELCAWSTVVPEALKSSVMEWRPYERSHYL